jgi:hypothetical protein
VCLLRGTIYAAAYAAADPSSSRHLAELASSSLSIVCTDNLMHLACRRIGLWLHSASWRQSRGPKPVGLSCISRQPVQAHLSELCVCSAAAVAWAHGCALPAAAAAPAATPQALPCSCGLVMSCHGAAPQHVNHQQDSAGCVPRAAYVAPFAAYCVTTHCSTLFICAGRADYVLAQLIAGIWAVRLDLCAVNVVLILS